MPDQIKYELGFSVVPGPPISKKDMFDVAYLCKGGGKLAAMETRELIVPVCGPGQLKLVVIAADQYGDGLKFKKAGGEQTWKLNMPVFLIGPGATALLGGELPEALIVTNGLDKEATINIYVGWDPMPDEDEETEYPKGEGEEQEPESSEESEQAPVEEMTEEHAYPAEQTAAPGSKLKKLTSPADEPADAEAT